MGQQPQQRLPGPAYITLALLLGLAVLIGWSIGSYPEQPAQRAVADSCKTITQPDRSAQQHQTPPHDLVGVEHNAEATGHNDAGDHQNEKSETDRRLADYTCQLAVYTANLAAFTKWLVIATIGIGIVGVWQGTNIQRSVNAAVRAADVAEESLIELERPIVFIHPTSAIFDKAMVPLPIIRMYFRNYGRVPARIVEIRSKLLFEREFPDIPDYGGSAAQAVMITLGPGDRVDWPFTMATHLTDEEWQEYLSDAKGFALFGYFKYRGVLDIEYTRGFTITHDRDTNNFRLFGGDAYNYETKEDRRRPATHST
jgi:hypothetical protein